MSQKHGLNDDLPVDCTAWRRRRCCFPSPHDAPLRRHSGLYKGDLTSLLWVKQVPSGAYNQNRAAWTSVETAEAPPHGRKLDTGQQLGPHPETAMVLGTRRQERAQALGCFGVLHVCAPGW